MRLYCCEPTTQTVLAGNTEYKALTQASLAENNEQLKAFYGLLMMHYRTSPLDLRRLLDAQQQHFMVAKADSDDCTSFRCIMDGDEGQLTESLSWQNMGWASSTKRKFSCPIFSSS